MSVLGSLLRRVAGHYGETWVKKGEASCPYLRGMIDKASRSVVMVTGELDPSLYEYSELPESIEGALRRGVRFEIVFHKDNQNIEQARDIFLKENRRIAELAKKYPELMKLYWRETRPEGHYTVVDNDAVFVEGPHKPRQERRAVLKPHTLKLGTTLAARFQTLAEDRASHPLAVH